MQASASSSRTSRCPGAAWLGAVSKRPRAGNVDAHNEPNTLAIPQGLHSRHPTRIGTRKDPTLLHRESGANPCAGLAIRSVALLQGAPALPLAIRSLA